MISFDFLRPAQPALLRALIEWRLPSAYYAPAAALCSVLFIAAGAHAIEATRLHAALALESAYRARFDESRVRLRAAGVEVRRVRDLIELDARVRRMSLSGYRNAQNLAGIANALPAHAWLTSIAYDGNDVVLQGRASGLSAVSGVLRGIERARRAGEPVLETTALDDRAEQAEKMSYTVRLRRSAP